VSQERLRRWFVHEHRGYRVRREVREVLLFAVHDLLKDAPFSRMDLISCRNLMIYLSREAQKRAMDLFHFALRPGGFLFLGSSESVDDDTPLFSVVHKKHRLYAHRPSARAGLPVSLGRGSMAERLAEESERLQQEHAALVLPGPGFVRTPGAPPPAASPLLVARAAHGSPRVAWDELHFKLIERYAPPSVVVTGENEIVHMSERAGQFLQMVGGQPTTNLLRLIRPELRVELRAALFRAAQSGQPVEVFRVPMTLDGKSRVVNIHVSPARELAPDFLLVVFDYSEQATGRAGRDGDGEESPAPLPSVLSNDLNCELQQLKMQLCDTVEQYEASNEELKASNEELHAMNEELRSASEELETSREELQSINEELTTVNAELKTKVEELGSINSVLHNLMASTQIATVFLDRELHIMRYTPVAAPLFNIIASDTGRPLSDLKHRLEYPEMTADAERVLASLVPVEREVPANDGRTFLARLLPYRTLDDRIGGVVVNFVDITERRRIEAELRARAEELERFNRAAVGRELRMVELKKEINALLARLGQPAKYSIGRDGETGDGSG
jgi:two-component system CheB/CheR fusion protein